MSCRICNKLIANIAEILVAPLAIYLIVGAFLDIDFLTIGIRTHDSKLQVYPRDILFCFLRYYLRCDFARQNGSLV